MPETIDIAEFRELGYLQEVNRRFFHPLGLALAVKIDEESGKTWLDCIWDSRKDPEGFIFFDEIDEEHVAFVDEEIRKRNAARKGLMGEAIQPPGWKYEAPCSD